MAVLDPIKLGIVPCKCGRLSNKRHCPECGCYTLNFCASKKDIITDRLTGQTKELPVYRCTSCGRYFNNEDWQNDNCNAPFWVSASTKKLNDLKGNLTQVSNEKVNIPNKGKAFNTQQMIELAAHAEKLKERVRKQKEQESNNITSISDISIGECKHWCDIKASNINCCDLKCNKMCSECPNKITLKGT